MSIPYMGIPRISSPYMGLPGRERPEMQWFNNVIKTAVGVGVQVAHLVVVLSQTVRPGFNPRIPCLNDPPALGSGPAQTPPGS